MDQTKCPDEGLYNTLLKSALRDALREVLMKTATEEVEKVIKNAESDFETSPSTPILITPTIILRL